MNFKLFSIFILSALAISAKAQSFKIVPLGVLGGEDESNLSSYMLAPAGSNNYVCLDAGTLYTGISKAIANKVFAGTAEQVLRQKIKGYLISHSHLDHLSGLVINSPADTNKTIYAFADCLKVFETHYFTPVSWSNFGDKGEAPVLKKYHYETLEAGKETAIASTDMTVTPYPLSHSNLTSTAFLVRSGSAYVLYLGDTGPDAVEKSANLHNLWTAVAPLIKDKRLKAIMIETSFPDEQPDKSLFGHFTPRWLMSEFDNLAQLTGGAASLKGFKVVITHLKPPVASVSKIKQQLKAENKLGLNLIFPEQGKTLTL
ncbi:MBL fold metallo-hydrolase [Mucilaginibacter ginkgonis]|uniref:3',5'-cyclic-nucleotide phosphodiesterase n=1 Tax=Mucilaginibacter ginkgonis TaxID=2682091 RepID=A0A6I4I0P3_9SPHI|nr:3',5'-cyclic-nucleotide phosphodiesterase [Mucilaginibacter ginkgonis]QQL48675.1 3',5'-cyclic-nucleotide phosphodiesterase [Mucilaginibacter ginkgonis]